MVKHIMFCDACKKYTMQSRCPVCGKKTVEAKPPKFSIQDRYGKYRREAKRKMLMEAGLL
ncbi:RNA-protein complex protein Nop10 [Candidatus Woesearchaeota archaeon]|nr:RNA-protein complex protein Nop10 [Candidatus Woesearchaeota archaeon]RLE40929.1 MAG: RNA-protein complex protein Nop10 [Candidatus Woesearchaeota archaeon]